MFFLKRALRGGRVEMDSGICGIGLLAKSESREMVMKMIDAGSFFEEYPQRMFYVGFMKLAGAWFPMCSVSDPGGAVKFDSLYVSLDYMAINELVQSIAGEAPGVEGTFVHYLLRDEVKNIMEAYDLRHVVLTHDDEDGAGCGCGCGCLHGIPGDRGLAH